MQPGRRAAERGQGGEVRHVSGVEQQRRLGAVQIGELLLQQHVVMVGAGDVAGAAGAGPAPVERLVHGRQHQRMLAHAEIVVGAPDGDLAVAARVVMGGVREAAGPPLEIGEHPIPPLAPQAGELVTEEILVLHGPLTYMRPTPCASEAYLASARSVTPTHFTARSSSPSAWRRRVRITARWFEISHT